MSVVAVKVNKEGIEISSDSITIRGWTQSKGENTKHTKLEKINGMIVGGVGYSEENMLMQLFCESTKPVRSDKSAILEFLGSFSEWKKKRTENHEIKNAYIIVFGGKAFFVNNYHIEEVVKYEAIGAGRDFALAVLHLGHSAKEAVEVACELSVFCELPTVNF